MQPECSRPTAVRAEKVSANNEIEICLYGLDLQRSKILSLAKSKKKKMAIFFSRSIADRG